MTLISFRAYRLGEHETITDEALNLVAGQTFAFRDEDRAYAGRAVEAVVRDGWIVITADLGSDDFPTAIVDLFTIGPANVYVVPEMPAEQRFVPTPSMPDWSTAPGSAGGPARFERSLDQGLAPIAADRWWYDRCADASHEWLWGPEFRWVSGDATRQ